MKKIISILLMVGILTTLLTISAYAQTEPTIKISSVSDMAGETVDVTLSLENNPGIIAMRIDLKYDKDVLTLTNVTDSGKLPGKNHSPEYTYPYSLYWENGTATEDIVVNDIIATLSFKISENAPVGSYPVSVSYDNDNYDIFNYGFDPIDFAVVAGNVTVNAPTPEIKDYSISASDIQIDEKITLKANLTTPSIYTGRLIFAIYNEHNKKMVDVELYNAAESVDASLTVGDATYGKLFWWNMETLEPYCECLTIEIK